VYDVLMAADVVTDDSVSKNLFAGLTTAVYRVSIQDATAPALVTRSPAAGATAVPLTADLVLTFNEPVAAGAGSVILYPSVMRGATTIAMNDAAVTVAGSTVRVSTGALFVSALNGQSYEVVVTADAVTDVATNAFVGVARGAYSFEVEDTVAPSLVSVRPRNETLGVPADTDFVLEFDSDVQEGSGSIVLSASGTAAVSLDVLGDQVRVVGRFVVVDPVAVLDAGLSGREFTMTMASGVLTHMASTPNVYAGLSGAEYVFSVSSTQAPRIFCFRRACRTPW
jgi:hypothetical protein